MLPASTDVLIGADGMHSTIRDQAGIGFPASNSALSYCLADVHLSSGGAARKPTR